MIFSTSHICSFTHLRVLQLHRGAAGVPRAGSDHRLKATCDLRYQRNGTCTSPRSLRLQVVLDAIDVPKGRIFQSTLFQSTVCVWNPESLDPSYSTQITNVNRDATCFSCVRYAAINNVQSLISGPVIGQLWQTMISTDTFLYSRSFIAGNYWLWLLGISLFD